jgi:hypothetical protein
MKLNHTFYISISSATTTGIEDTKVAENLDYVKMQNYYSGGRDPETYLEDLKAGGITAGKLVYGISTEWPEINDTDVNRNIRGNLANAVKLVKEKKYAGIMTWRLNSDNLLYENAVQVWLYNQFNSPALKTDHPDSEVLAAWYSKHDNGGRKPDPNEPENWLLVSPWKFAE